MKYEIWLKADSVETLMLTFDNVYFRRERFWFVLFVDICYKHRDSIVSI